MVKTRRAIVFSFTITVLLSVPVASENISIDEVEEGFNAFVETDYSDSFRLNISTGMQRMNLLDSENRYSYLERPSIKKQKLVTPRGVLEIKRSPNVSLKIVETPYGTLKTGFRNGENISEFSGNDEMREKVEEIKKSLLANSTVKMRESEAKKRIVMQKMLPEVRIESNYSSDEIEIINREDRNISLSGWTLRNEGEAEGDPYPASLDIVLEERGSHEMSRDVDKNDEIILEDEFGRLIDSAE